MPLDKNSFDVSFKIVLLNVNRMPSSVPDHIEGAPHDPLGALRAAAARPTSMSDPRTAAERGSNSTQAELGPFPASNTVAAPTRSRGPNGVADPVPRACGLRLGCSTPRQDRGQANKTHATVDTCPGLRAGTNRNSSDTLPATLEEGSESIFARPARRSPLRAWRHVAAARVRTTVALGTLAWRLFSAPRDRRASGPGPAGRCAELQYSGGSLSAARSAWDLHLYIEALFLRRLCARTRCRRPWRRRCRRRLCPASRLRARRSHANAMTRSR